MVRWTTQWKAWSLALAASVGSVTPVLADEFPRSAAMRFAAPASQDVLPQSATRALPPVEGEEVVAAAGSLSLPHLEATALAQNPAIARVAAQLSAAQGTTLQAGLAPNPVIGYQGNEIGNEGEAGQNGAFLSQTLITGGKLRLSQGAFNQRVAELQQQLAAMQMAVVSDVRIAYYQAVAAQRRARLAARLVQIGEETTQTARGLFEAQEVSRIDLLQAEIERDRAKIRLQQAQSEHVAAWRQLLAVTGLSDRPLESLTDTLDQLPPELEWESALQTLLASSPEIAAAHTRIEQARWQLQREHAEPIPDLNVSGGVAYDSATGDTITGVQAQLPIPLWNKNQGGIRRAQSELTAARADLQRVELNLQKRLASAFQRYSTARYSVAHYGRAILPHADESLNLVTLGYRQGELSYLTLLTAQRTFYGVHLDYVDALSQLHQAQTEIESSLLSGSLAIEAMTPSLREP